MFDTKTNESNDEGVSPVIGVILMVAITVILAAVIGAFVLDMAGNLQQNASASVQFSENTANKDYKADGLVNTSDDGTTGNAPEPDELGGSGDGDGGQVTIRTVSMQKADFVEVRVQESTTILNDGSRFSNSTSSDDGLPDIGGTASDGTDNASDNDIGAVGKTAYATYEDGTSGTISIVGYLKGNGSVLQTYNYGG